MVETHLRFTHFERVPDDTTLARDCSNRSELSWKPTSTNTSTASTVGKGHENGVNICKIGIQKVSIVGGWTNPFEKYARSSNWIISRGIGVKIPQKMFELPPPRYQLDVAPKTPSPMQAIVTTRMNMKLRDSNYETDSNLSHWTWNPGIFRPRYSHQSESCRTRQGTHLSWGRFCLRSMSCEKSLELGEGLFKKFRELPLVEAEMLA